MPYNLLKIDPITGAIVWKAYVPGSFSPTLADGVRIEALHGTNNVVMSLNTNTTSSGGLPYYLIVMVDDSGVQQWAYPQVTGNFNRIFDTDSSGGIYVAPLDLSGHTSPLSPVVKLDSSGSTVWVRDFISAIQQIRCGSDFVLGSRSQIVTPAMWDIAQSTGSNTFAAPGSQPAPLAIASDDIYINSPASTSVKSYLRDAGGPILQNTDTTYSISSARFGPGGFSAIGPTTSPNYLIGCVPGSSSITPTFKLTTIGGISGAGAFPAKDTCSDVTAYGSGSTVGYYFAGATAIGSGSTYFNIVKTDAAGTLVWTQLYGPRTIGTGTGIVSGICIADDGYLYATGNVVNA